MKIRLLPLLLLFTFCTSQNQNEYLAKIYAKGSWDHNGILYLTESANVNPIEQDSINYFLTINEIGESKRYVYKNYGNIYNSKKLDIYLILKTDTISEGREYRFYLRTYKGSSLVDTLTFAQWNDNSQQYQSGEIDKSLIITIVKNNDVNEVYTITSDGEFIKIESEKY